MIFLTHVMAPEQSPLFKWPLVGTEFDIPAVELSGPCTVSEL